MWTQSELQHNQRRGQLDLDQLDQLDGSSTEVDTDRQRRANLVYLEVQNRLRVHELDFGQKETRAQPSGASASQQQHAQSEWPVLTCCQKLDCWAPLTGGGA